MTSATLWFQGAGLVAVVGDKDYGVAVTGSGYQVSWDAKHSAASSGSYTIKFYDEEGFSAYTKARDFLCPRYASYYDRLRAERS